MIAALAAEERSVVTFGTTTIPYRVRRSPRRGTVAVAVEPNRQVVVTAPADAPLERLDWVVRQKAAWIVERQRRRSDLPPPLPTRQFVSGETFYYLGKQHRLLLERGAGLAPVRLVEGRLYLPVPANLGIQNQATYARAALMDWYLVRARAVLPARVGRFVKRVGVAPGRVLVTTAASKRWGSASNDRTVRLSWRIVQAPSGLIDYVVAHELVHLVHRDHSAAFWATLGRIIPDYDARKERLRTVGSSLVW